MKKHVWRRRGDAHQQSLVAMAGLTQNKTTRTPSFQTHTDTRTQRVVGYFKHNKTVICKLHFWPLWLRAQMGKEREESEADRGGSWGWGRGPAGDSRWGYNGNTAQSASRLGQGSHLLSCPPLLLHHSFICFHGESPQIHRHPFELPCCI